MDGILLEVDHHHISILLSYDVIFYFATNHWGKSHSLITVRFMELKNVFVYVRTLQKVLGPLIRTTPSCDEIYDVFLVLLSKSILRVSTTIPYWTI